MRSNFPDVRRFSIVFACVLGFCADSLANTATIRNFTGAPRILASGALLKFKKGDAIPDNAIVRTGPHDSLDIYFDDGGRVISMGPNSQMRIELPTRSVVVERGEVVGSVRKKSTEELAPLTIRTPMGVASVTRGDVVVDTLQQQISVVSGSATYQSGASTTGEAGKTAQISAGSTLTETVSTPVILPTTPESSAQLLRRVDRVATSDVKVPLGGGKLPPPPPPPSH